MKIQINTNALKTPLVVFGAFAKKSTLPILETVLFDCSKDGRLRLTAADQQIYCRHTPETVTLEATSPGGCIELTRLRAIFDVLPANEIASLTFDADSQKVNISCGKVKMNAPFMLAEDYLDTDRFFDNQGEFLFDLAIEDTRNILVSNSFAASKDEYRPAMTGIAFQNIQNQLVCISTNSFVLSKSTLSHINCEDDGFIAYLPFLQLLAKIGEGARINRVKRGKLDFLQAECGNYIIASSVINENFPPWQSVIPSDFEHSFSFNLKDALNALRIAMLGANLTTKAIALKLTSGENEQSGILSFNGYDDETHIFSETDISVQCDGPKDLLFGINGDFMNNILRGLTGETITIKMNEPSKPIIFTDDNDHLILAMPIKLSNKNEN